MRSAPTDTAKESIVVAGKVCNVCLCLHAVGVKYTIMRISKGYVLGNHKGTKRKAQCTEHKPI